MIDDLARQIALIDAEIEDLNEARAKLRRDLMNEMGDTSSYTSPDGISVTVRAPSRRLLKSGETLFLAQHPEAVKEVFDAAKAKKINPHLLDSLKVATGDGSLVVKWDPQPIEQALASDGMEMF